MEIMLVLVFSGSMFFWGYRRGVRSVSDGINYQIDRGRRRR